MVVNAPVGLGMIHDLLDVGPRFDAAEAAAQLTAIHDVAHPLCRLAGDQRLDDLTTHNSQAFKAALIETFLKNETHNVADFYRLRAPRTDGDGFAFGPPQWTVSFLNRMNVLVSILEASGWTSNGIDGRIDQVRRYLSRNGEALRLGWNDAPSSRATITQLVQDVNNVLVQEGNKGLGTGNRVWASYYGYADSQGTYHPGLLDERVAHIHDFVHRLRTNAGTRQVAEYVDSHPELAVDIADRTHQHGNVDGLIATIQRAISTHASFDIGDYYAWALAQPGPCGDRLRRLTNVAAVAADCGWQSRSADETRRINDSVANALRTCARGHPLSNEEIQAAYDQVRQDQAQPPWNSRGFTIGTNGDYVALILLPYQGAYPYGSPQGATSANARAVWIGVGGPDAEAMFEAIEAAGVPLGLQYPGELGIPRTVLSANTATFPEGGAAGAQGAIDWGSRLLAAAESAAAAAQGIPNPRDNVAASGGAFFPGTTVPLPASVIEAALDPNWPSIAPMVAAQASMQDPPTLLMDLEGADGQTIPSRSPFDTGWLAPGDGLLVTDGSTVRSLTADGPGETVTAFHGDAILDGRAGNDYLWAGAGNDTLLGGPGDYLHGGSGNDVFVSGPNDVIYAGGATNTFQVSRGVGSVTVYANGGGTDTLAMGADVDPEDVHVIQDGADLLLKIAAAEDQTGPVDQVRLANQIADGAAGGPYPLSQVTFADGTAWSAATLQTKSLIATEPGQVIIGFSGVETLVGRTGHDTLWAGSGTDTLVGGPDDVLYGGPGNDVFVSGRNNNIFGGTGTNTVKFGRQDGQDILNADAGGVTTVELGTGLKPLDLVFALHPNAAQGEDLQVSIHNSTDDFGRGDDRNKRVGDDGSKHRAASGITVTNWKAATGGSGTLPVATFETKHAQLAGIDVGPLIQAMATFTADTGLSWDQAIEQRPRDVETILTPYWHTTRQQPAEGWTREDHGDHGHGWSR